MSEMSLRFLNAMADAFMQGRMDFVTACFAFPQPLFLEGDLQVFGSADTLTEALVLYRDAALAIGTVSIRPRIVAEGLPVRGYSSIWVEWDHLDGDGTCLRTNQVRYTIHQPPGALCPTIEMIDYTVVAFPAALDPMVQAKIA